MEVKPVEVLQTRLATPVARPIVAAAPAPELPGDNFVATPAAGVTRSSKKPSKSKPKPRPEPVKKAPRDVQFSFNPQDPLVMEPETITLHGLLQGDRPQTEHVRLSGPLTTARDGSYIFGNEDRRHTGGQAFASVQHTVDLFWDAFNLKKWNFHSPQITVHAKKGVDFNADYEREDGSLNFYEKRDAKTGKVVYAGDSFEIVGHEVGHAILDAIRPKYFDSWSPDAGGFHESFGDIIAFLGSMQNDRVVNRVVDQTGGDLSKTNIASEIGEELGVAVNHDSGKNVTGGKFLRNANNNLKWIDPSTLKDDYADPNRLGSEGHNFARLWTGAFYDVFKGLVDANRAAGQDAAEAIHGAAKEGTEMLARLMQKAPEGDFTYREMAQAFVQSDRELNHGQHADLLTRVFTDRQILPESSGAGIVGNLPLTGVIGTTSISTRLGSQFGADFAGASVATEVSGQGAGLVGNLHAEARLQDQVGRAIKNGDILVVQGDQKPTAAELHKQDGSLYKGYVMTVNGQKVITRAHIAD